MIAGSGILIRACLAAVLSFDRTSSRDNTIEDGRRKSNIYGDFTTSQTATKLTEGDFSSDYQDTS